MYVDVYVGVAVPEPKGLPAPFALAVMPRRLTLRRRFATLFSRNGDDLIIVGEDVADEVLGHTHE